jgi:hypothetical protein
MLTMGTGGSSLTSSIDQAPSCARSPNLGVSRASIDNTGGSSSRGSDRHLSRVILETDLAVDLCRSTFIRHLRFPHSVMDIFELLARSDS